MNPHSENLAVRSATNFAVAGNGSAHASGASGVGAADDGYRGIRITIWIYFWLLIVEGMLRKWVFPGSSNLLLLVRDPVVAVCYILAVRNGKFPFGPFVLSALILGMGSFAVSFITNPLGDMQRMLLVTGFGFHANFFHLPLIFLIRDAFDVERLRAIGKWTLLIAPLAAVLIFMQYKAPQDAWVNRGAGKDSLQITVGAYGIEKIRPAGFFSYNTGNAAYLAWVAAFLVQALLVKKGISKQLLIVSAISLAVAGSLSISRTCVLSIALVLAAGFLCMVLAPKLANRSVLIAFLCTFLYVLLSRFSVLGEAMGILQARVQESGGLHEGGVVRFFEIYIDSFRTFGKAGFLGSGLGMGTNAAGGLVTGERAFMLGENEWGRHFLESGVFLGGAFILWRLVLLAQLLRVSFTAVKALNPLPMLLFSSCFLLVLSAPLGVPMTLGFVVMGAGMTLAAARESEAESTDGILIPEMQPKPLARGRSAYAERLHSGQQV